MGVADGALDGPRHITPRRAADHVQGVEALTPGELEDKDRPSMEVSRFADMQVEFMQRVSRAVYCSMATIDRQHRPRSRIMHLVWDGPVGWAISWPQSHKAKHLAYHPHVSLAYIQEKDSPVYIDCAAAWVDDTAEKLRIWELHKATPPPLGFDPQPHYETIDHPYYGLLRFTPWRIELGNLHGTPIIWRP